MEDAELIRQLEVIIARDRSAKDKQVNAVKTGVWHMIATVIARLLNIGLHIVNRAIDRLWEVVRVLLG